MFATSLEQNRYAKGDDGAEANPPGKFHHRQPARLRVELAAENSGDVVRQTAQNCDDDKADDHREHVAEIIASGFGQHAGKKHAEHRAVGVTVHFQNDWDATYIWVD